MNAQRETQHPPRALTVRLLGPLEAELEGEPIALGPPKQRALLAQLAMRPGEAVPVERLIDDLWPEGPPETARHAIHVLVSGLRKAFRDPTCITARSRAYVLRLEPGELDLQRFRELVAEARPVVAARPREATERLSEALALWRGRAFADLDGEPGVRDLILELENERLAAVELHLEAQLAAGRHGELVPKLERLVAEYPAREAFHAQLMLALYRSGRQADALATYQRARRMLLNELGLEPTLRLRELQGAILRQDAALTVESEELRSRRHLPAQPDAFIGREHELAGLTELLSAGRARLVTLTGPGGVGKTRLAVAVAHRLAASYPHGVWFVDNAPLRDPALFRDVVAHALGARVELRRHLEGKRLLLVLDNFEQILDAAITVADLLRACPELDVLVTSRERLRLSGEHIYALAPLPESEAVALFRARARAARHDYRSTDAETATCRRLEGLPLAIELAAARLADLEPRDLLDELERRLPALTGGPRDVPARQQTLRETIKWSHDLLADAEQRVFASLGVFAGGCTAEAAAQVCGADVDALRTLTEKSLLRAVGDRYGLLETVREYALERLDAKPAAEAVRRRHADWCVALLEQAWPELRDGDQQPWLERLESERDNIRAALDYAVSAGLDDLELRLAARAGRFWYMQSYLAEGRSRLRHALEHSGGDAGLRAAALEYEALIAIDQGDVPEAERLTAELLRTAGDLEPEERPVALNVRAAALHESGDPAEAARVYEQGLALSRDLGLPWAVRTSLNNLGACAVEQRDWARARRLLEEALALEPEKDLHLTAMIHANLAFVAVEEGAFEDARAHLGEGLRLVSHLGLHDVIVAEALLASARVVAAEGDVASSRRLAAAVRRFLADTGARRWTTFGTMAERVDTLDAELGSAGTEEAASNEPLSLDDAVAFAIERLAAGSRQERSAPPEATALS